MIKYFVFLMLFVAASLPTYAQVFFTRSGYLGFFSKMPLEDIRAENKQVTAVIDTDKKSIGFTLLVKGFVFQKALMQEHFNENYIESDLFPKAVFLGSYTGALNPAADGLYAVQAEGKLTLHGVTQNLKVPATIEVKEGKLIARSNFQLTPSDFNIQVPSLVREKIAKQIDVQVAVSCNPK